MELGVANEVFINNNLASINTWSGAARVLAMAMPCMKGSLLNLLIIGCT